MAGCGRRGGLLEVNEARAAVCPELCCATVSAAKEQCICGQRWVGVPSGSQRVRLAHCACSVYHLAAAIVIMHGGARSRSLTKNAAILLQHSAASFAPHHLAPQTGSRTYPVLPGRTLLHHCIHTPATLVLCCNTHRPVPSVDITTYVTKLRDLKYDRTTPQQQTRLTPGPVATTCAFSC